MSGLTTTECLGRHEVEQPKVGPEGARRAGASESKDTENTERATPETNAHYAVTKTAWPTQGDIDFARKLERERDEARERLHKVLKVLDDYDQAIKNPSSPFWEAFKKWFTWGAAK